MNIPAKTEPLLWGAATGAIALAIVGFTWGGWVTAGTAQQRAGAGAEQAMVASLAPICVAQFRKDPAAQASLAALKKIVGWEQGDYVSKGGWATMPGSTAEPNREVAAACADALGKLSL
jgi:hypothetical protein